MSCQKPSSQAVINSSSDSTSDTRADRAVVDPNEKPFSAADQSRREDSKEPSPSNAAHAESWIEAIMRPLQRWVNEKYPMLTGEQYWKRLLSESWTDYRDCSTGPIIRVSEEIVLGVLAGNEIYVNAGENLTSANYGIKVINNNTVTTQHVTSSLEADFSTPVQAQPVEQSQDNKAAMASDGLSSANPPQTSFEIVDEDEEEDSPDDPITTTVSMDGKTFLIAQVGELYSKAAPPKYGTTPLGFVLAAKLSNTDSAVEAWLVLSNQHAPSELSCPGVYKSRLFHESLAGVKDFSIAQVRNVKERIPLGRQKELDLEVLSTNTFHVVKVKPDAGL